MISFLKCMNNPCMQAESSLSRSSKNLLNFYQRKRRHTPENGTLHSRRHGELKLHKECQQSRCLQWLRLKLECGLCSV
jgi:hypothetical protein